LRTGALELRLWPDDLARDGHESVF
jgi:hypothetical protein